jgi:hypothetical protein
MIIANNSHNLERLSETVASGRAFFHYLTFSKSPRAKQAALKVA